MWLASRNHFSHKLCIFSKMCILFNHAPEIVGLVFGWVMLCPYVLWTQMLWFVCLYDSEHYISSTARISTNNKHSSLWIFTWYMSSSILFSCVYDGILFYISLNIFITSLDIEFLMIIEILATDNPSINWQFKVIACNSIFIVSDFKDKKMYPKRQINLDFKKASIMFLINILEYLHFSSPGFVLQVSCMFSIWRLFQMKF